MTPFAYRAVDARGRIVRGHLEAGSLTELEKRLARLELELLDGKPARQGRWPWRRPWRAQLPRRELINFCFHLEQFLQAGVPIIDSLVDLRDAIRHPGFRETLAGIVASIEGGATLSEALERHPHSFDGVFCSLVRAGEKAGELPTVLRAISAALKRDDELAAFTRRIAIYPAIVALVILAAIGVALIHVVPELARLFHSAGQPLPLQTRLLIGLSDFVRAYGSLLVAAAVAALLAFRHALSRQPDLRRRFDGFLLRLPLLGEVRRRLILARFTGLFALMYSSGITIVDALAVAEDVVGNAAMKDGLQRAGRGIERGFGLSEAFAAVELFPPLVTRMLRVGESTGALDTALANVSYFYERDVREAIERLQAAVEPALTVVLGLILLAVMSAVMLPIYDIVTRMKL